MKEIKYIFEGTVLLMSPIIIGSGESENTDNDILLGKDGKPYIPGTTFTGIIRHLIEDADSTLAERVFGYSKKKSSMQSALVCSDFEMINKQADVVVRDGIKIDNKTGMVEDKKKFDYEIIEKGSRFKFIIIVNTDIKTQDDAEKVISFIKNGINSGKIRIGAKTNNGLGKIDLMESKIYRLDLSEKKQFICWLKRDYSKYTYSIQNDYKIPFADEVCLFIDARVKNSLIVRSYSKKPEDPDAVSIKSGGNNIIPGSSFKGALRNRAVRICNTLDLPQSYVESLFGYVNVENPKVKPKKGRFLIEEYVIPNVVEEVQHRIKNDRFTGGTINGALFDMQALFAKDSKTSKIFINVNKAKDEDLGLIILLLKDIWTGDIAIGGEKNIGRGVLEADGAEIKYKNRLIKLDSSGILALSIDDKNFLQSCIDKFVKQENNDGR